MRYLNRLLDLAPYTDRAELLRGLKRQNPAPASPLVLPFASDGDTSYKLIIEFDQQERMVFGELRAAIKGEEKALSELRRLAGELVRIGVAKPFEGYRPPIRRTSIAMTHLLAWSTLEMDDLRQLQLLVGIPYSAAAQTFRTHFAVAVHVEANLPGYGPRQGDLSTGQAKGWEDYHRFARPDVIGRTVLIRDAQTQTPIGAEPRPSDPDSVFHIFP